MLIKECVGTTNYRLLSCLKQFINGWPSLTRTYSASDTRSIEKYSLLSQDLGNFLLYTRYNIDFFFLFLESGMKLLKLEFNWNCEFNSNCEFN